ncbi:MAG: UDP-N-acetylmuramoyl-tripeptide--D-alanyl-D-alanine ligase [Actinomycetales bacterium]
MLTITAAELAAITHGRLSATAAPLAVIGLGNIVTDSRESFPGAVYVAKPGEFSDGHAFIPAAVAAGAVLVIAERDTTDDGGTAHPAVIVEDAVLALGALAAHVVRRIRAAGELTVIAITGSAGKTTTKDLLAGILSASAATVAPTGSFNGEVGVPLTVFRADESTRYLVIEMGATRLGHISYLCSLVRPDIGVVLGVGSAHTGEFGGVDNIATAKGELVEALAATGAAVLNADDARVAAMAARGPAPVTYFGRAEGPASAKPGARVLASDAATDQDGHPVFGLSFSAEPDAGTAQVRSGLLGEHHLANLLGAAAAAHLAGIPAAAITAGLDGRGPASRWRMELTERADGITVINDAYNANPDSMRAALRTLAELGSGPHPRRTWAVLGPMYELGADSVREHDLLGRVAVRLNISRLVVVGAEARAMHVGAVMEGSWGDESVFVADLEEAHELLRRELRAGDIVLVKSSNAANLRYLGDRIALRSVVTDGQGQQGAAASEQGTDGERTRDQ